MYHSNTYNFINQHDLVAKAVSPLDYRVVIVRDLFAGKSLDSVADFLAQEDMLIEGMEMGGHLYERRKNEKTTKYRKRLDELCHTQIIYHSKGSGLQHSFDDPNYQTKLRELIDNLYGHK